MLEVVGAQHRQDRAEYFLGCDAGARPCGDHHGRADVPTALRHLLVAVDHLALLARELPIAAHSLPRVLVDERPHHRAELPCMTDRHCGAGANQPLDQLVEHLAHGDHACGG